MRNLLTLCIVVAFLNCGMGYLANNRRGSIRLSTLANQHRYSSSTQILDSPATSKAIGSKLVLLRKRVVESVSKKIPLPTRTMMSYIWPSSDDSDDSDKSKDKNLSWLLFFSMVAMFWGKYFNLQVPLILQRTVDSISTASKSGTHAGKAVYTAIVMYGFSRALSVIFSEIKTCLFVYVSQSTLRKFANRIFGHLHSLDNEFHLKTPSGVVSINSKYDGNLYDVVVKMAQSFIRLLRLIILGYQNRYQLLTFVLLEVSRLCCIK